MDSYQILVGVGRLYRAPVGTTFPALTDTPAAPWRDLGETQDGVTITLGQEVEEIKVDQRTGAVKAARNGESLTVESNLALGTLENMALIMGGTVTDTPAGSGTIGTREITLHRGAAVEESAFLFRATSPYGPYPAQYELPRGYLADDLAIEAKVDDNVKYPVAFHALEDLTASDGDEFGRLVAQDAAAL